MERKRVKSSIPCQVPMPKRWRESNPHAALQRESRHAHAQKGKGATASAAVCYGVTRQVVGCQFKVRESVSVDKPKSVISETLPLRCDGCRLFATGKS